MHPGPDAPDDGPAERSIRSGPVLAGYLVLSAAMLTFAYVTVHDRPAVELTRAPGAQRSHTELTQWIDHGYWHFAGLLVLSPNDQPLTVYRSSTGGYRISSFLLEKVVHMFTGRYSWRLLAFHNQLVTALTAALVALLGFRLALRTGLLPGTLAFAAGVAAEAIHFTFPDNLWLFWEMSAQAMWLPFAITFFLIEERCERRGRTRALTLAQAFTAFGVGYMEFVLGVAFLGAFAIVTLLLRNSARQWRRFALVAALPCLVALLLFKVQLAIADARFGTSAITGTPALSRSGLDGDTRYYTTHLDIAFGRDVARSNFGGKRELFTWPSMFYLGTASLLTLLVVFALGRAPSLPVVVLATLTGTWVILAAVFSQAVVIHPYLFDIVLATPLILALFVVAPALLEARAKRRGAVILVLVFGAIWYSLYQMRLYALWYPLPSTQAVVASQQPEAPVGAHMSTRRLPAKFIRQLFVQTRTSSKT